jgi:hypothetical protein
MNTQSYTHTLTDTHSAYTRTHTYRHTHLSLYLYMHSVKHTQTHINIPPLFIYNIICYLEATVMYVRAVSSWLLPLAVVPTGFHWLPPACGWDAGARGSPGCSRSPPQTNASRCGLTSSPQTSAQGSGSQGDRAQPRPLSVDQQLSTFSSLPFFPRHPCIKFFSFLTRSDVVLLLLSRRMCWQKCI